jgi:hypothetical protein
MTSPSSLATLTVARVIRTQLEVDLGYAAVFEASDGARVGALYRGTLKCGRCGWAGCEHLKAARAARKAGL